MIRFTLCFSCLCVLFTSAIAQNISDPGYIIGHDRDTVKGYIEIQTESELTTSVKFKKEIGGSTTEYHAADIAGFGMGKTSYRSLEFLNTISKTHISAFVKQLVTGDYDLYSYVTPDRNFYILRKDSTDEFMYDQLISAFGEVIEEGNYLNMLHFISVNCPGISNLYDRVHFDDRDMAAFVLKADNCLSGGNAVSFYEKSKTKVEPYIFAGALPIAGKNQFTASFNVRFSVPRIDKKTSINIGLNYSSFTVQTIERADNYHLYTLSMKNNMYSIPVTFQYNFTTTLIQPYCYAGLSGIYSMKNGQSYTSAIPSTLNQSGLALVFGLGLEASIISKLYFRVDWRYEFQMQYPNIGLEYRF
jgi:hypothetical protein